MVHYKDNLAKLLMTESLPKLQKVREYDQDMSDHTLKINPRYLEEETLNTNSHLTARRQVK